MKRSHLSTTIPLIAAGILAFSAPANASDLLDGVLDQSADQPAGVSVNWSGVYVGGRIGVGNANHDLSLEAYDNDDATGNGNANHIGLWGDEDVSSIELLGLNGVNSLGILGGGQIGADKQMGRFVAGVFGSYDISNMETEFTVLDETTVIAEKDYEWSAGARLGVLVNPSTLAYALAAYTETEYKFDDDHSQKYSGVTVGGGIEFAATNSVFLGLEGTHTFYNEETLMDEEFFGEGIRLTDDLDETKIMGTLKIKLNSF